jgi:hypothetical protein
MVCSRGKEREEERDGCAIRTPPAGRNIVIDTRNSLDALIERVNDLQVRL